jgi:hypothetical protein
MVQTPIDPRPGIFYGDAVRFGMPGVLRVAPLETDEPAKVNDPWPDGWIPLGYTDEGSVINYELSSDNVEVAEELDVFARVTTGRDASVEFALAEMTYLNLNIAFNGGILEAGDQDGLDWTFEPPDLGSEQRIMLGWDALPDTPKNDLRYVFRQCLQNGSLGMENRKGATKSTIPVTFALEKPDSGLRLLKVFGFQTLNPQPMAALVAATGATAGTPGTYTPGGATVPANLAALQSAAPPVVAAPLTAWTTGQHIVLGNAAHAFWDSDSWEAGEAP